MGMDGQRHTRPLYPWERDAVTIVQEAGWAPEPVRTGAENLVSTGITSPDSPACSESLYRLSHPGAQIRRDLKKNYNQSLKTPLVRGMTSNTKCAPTLNERVNFYGHNTDTITYNKKIQRYARDAGVYLLQNYSTCFGCLSHPSTGVHQTVTAAFGTGHITYQGNDLMTAWPNSSN